MMSWFWKSVGKLVSPLVVKLCKPLVRPPNTSQRPEGNAFVGATAA